MAKRFNENIELLRADSQKEFERLYIEYMPYIYGRVRKKLKLKNQAGYSNISELDDEFITFYNDVWVMVKKDLHKYDSSRGKFLTFFLFAVGRVMTKTITDKYYSKRSVKYSEDDASEFIRLADEQEPDNELMDEMNKRISKLSKKKQDFLKYYMEKTTRKTPAEGQAYRNIVTELKTGKTIYQLKQEQNAIKNK